MLPLQQSALATLTLRELGLQSRFYFLMKLSVAVWILVTSKFNLIKKRSHMSTLTHKQFLRRANSKVSAQGFLDSYNDHIRTVYPEADAAMDRYQKNEMLPTPTLEFVRQVVSQHIMLGMLNRAEESIRKSQQTKKTSKSGSTGQGRYDCQFFHRIVHERTGEVVIERWTDHSGHHTFCSDTFQAAERICDRKLSDMCGGLYCLISQTLPNGKELTTKVMRDDAIARFMKVPAGPACKTRPQNGSMKNVMRVHNYVATFSGG